MTQTIEPTAGTEPRVEAGPQQRVDAWLADFEAALAARDVERAAGMFATTSFWRDLVAFTWNIKTVEGRDGVADLLRATLDATDPRGFHTTEEPTEADGVHRRLDRVRDRGRPRPRPPAADRRGRVDAAHHAVRAQGPRGADGRARAHPARSTARARTG